MTILSFIEPTEFNWDILRTGVELGDDATDDQVRLAEKEDTLEERKNLLRASRIALVVGGVIVFCIVILWPMPMYGSGYIFSEQCKEPLRWISNGGLYGLDCGRVHLALACGFVNHLFRSMASAVEFHSTVEVDDRSSQVGGHRGRLSRSSLEGTQ
jgi:hypothetical protein